MFKLERSIEDIRIWKPNLLNLNDGKTEFIVFSCGIVKKMNEKSNLSIGHDKIKALSNVTYLRFQIDSECKNTKRVNKVCSSLYMTIEKISKICNDISSSTAMTLMQPLVLFCL